MARRTETRILRPFQGLNSVEKLFEKSTLLVEDKRYEAGSIILPQAMYQECSYKLSIGFELNKLRSAIEEISIPYVDTALILVSRGRTLRTTQIQFIHHLRNDNLNAEFDFEVQANPLLFKDRAGFISTFALVLNRTLKQKPLQPFLTGTWLGRSKFVIGLQTDPSSISPQKLTQAIRNDRHIGDESFSYIAIANELLDVDNLIDAVTIYLDEDALSLLQTDPYSSTAVSIQTQLVCDIVFQLLNRIVNLAIFTYGPHAGVADLAAGSGARLFIEEMSRKIEIPVAGIVTATKEDPSWVLARIQNAFGLRKTMLKTLKES